jgi:archaellum component FlaC
MTTDQIDISPDSLKKVAKRLKIEEELKKLKIKVEKLKIRSEIEEIDVSNEINPLEQEIKRLIEDQEKFGSIENPFLDLLTQQKNSVERLNKLEKKKGEIQTSVYESLKNEYLGEKEVITNQIKQAIDQLREIKQGASKGAHSLKYSIEELSVRKEIEEIPEDVFNEQISNLKSELVQSEELQEAVDFLLEMVSK